MKKETFWTALSILVAIPLFPSIISLIINLFRGFDSWVYEEGSFLFNFLIYWTGLELAGKVIIALLVVMAIAYIGFPLYKFYQGIIVKSNERKLDEVSSEYDSPEWKKHRLWIGAPNVWAVSLLYIIWVVLAFNLQESLIIFVEDKEVLLFFLFVGPVAIYILLIARLFFGGLFGWIRNHGNNTLKRRAKNKFLFSFYYVGFLILIVVLVNLLIAT